MYFEYLYLADSWTTYVHNHFNTGWLKIYIANNSRLFDDLYQVCAIMVN